MIKNNNWMIKVCIDAASLDVHTFTGLICMPFEWQLETSVLKGFSGHQIE